MTDEIVMALHLSEIARKGTWPEPGGSLDQTEWFLSFCRFAWSRRDILMSERGLRELTS